MLFLPSCAFLPDTILKVVDTYKISQLSDYKYIEYFTLVEFVY